MIVKNYYGFSEQELDVMLDNIRQWLWNFPKHEERGKVLLALAVAINAKDTYALRKSDPWIQEALDILIN